MSYTTQVRRSNFSPFLLPWSALLLLAAAVAAMGAIGQRTKAADLLLTMSEDGKLPPKRKPVPKPRPMPLRDPPAVEIWSGKALNDLLKTISKSGPLNRGPNVPLKEETLKNINLADPAFAGDVALLKAGGKLNWPNALKDRRFDDARERFAKKLKLAAEQLKDRKPVPAATVNDLRSFLKTLNDQLTAAAEDLSPTQYIEARRYLNRAGLAVKALDSPKVVNYFNGRWTARGRTVAELVHTMNKEGLRFASAAPGEEDAYRTLHQALWTFADGLARKGKP
jgi:hypothetical protein